MFSKIKKSLKSLSLDKLMLLIGATMVVGYFAYSYFFAEGFRTLGKMGSRKEIVLFHMEGCGHCEKLMPTWDVFEKNYSTNTHVHIGKINVTQKPEAAEQYGIESFPTIVYINDEEIVDVYQGDRTYNSLVQFLNYVIGN